MQTDVAGTKVVPITPVSAPDVPAVEVGEVVSLDAAPRKIYPRSVQGRFARWRWVIVGLTQWVFYGLPWLQWGHRQAVLFDLEARRFFIFGLVLYPQDFIYLTGLLVISAFSLFLFTAIAGRLWCGYACPQTVYSEIFLWIERRIEGDRSARMRLDSARMSGTKLGKKLLKHMAWTAVSLWTGWTFVGYFVPMRELGGNLLAGELGAWSLFWIFFYGAATYGNAGFMREQVCKYMCPYARFQSAMFDKDTLIVTYDTLRGEPRGARSRRADPQKPGLGACVDCSLCVQVCPTGIDIRKGLQYECIGCGACADVCDTVMARMGDAGGLVRYSTHNAMAHHWSREQILARVLRPRVLIYAFLLLLFTLVLFIHLALRAPLKVDVVRDRAALSRVVAGGSIENIYRLQIMNATERELHFRMGVDGLPGLRIADEQDFRVMAAESMWVPVRVQLPHDSAEAGSHPIDFVIQAYGQDVRIQGSLREKSVFLVPR